MATDIVTIIALPPASVEMENIMSVELIAAHATLITKVQYLTMTYIHFL